MGETQLRRLQLIQLKMLSDIHRLCERNQIRYFLVGGTLLGAVRHKGFIPWDDDVDIAMPRNDYQRFLAIAQAELGQTYFVQNFGTDQNYSRYITKIRLNGTSYIEDEVRHVDMHHGIFIDIFPLDNVSEPNGVALLARGMVLRMLFAIKGIKNGLTSRTSSNLKKAIKMILRPITLLIPDHVLNAVFDYVCTMSNGNNGKYTTSFASGYGWKKQLVPNEVYGEGIKVWFEGHQFNAPEQWHVLLTQIYGDYMELPPLEKRYSGHRVVHIDFGEYVDVL